MTGLKIN